MELKLIKTNLIINIDDVTDRSIKESSKEQTVNIKEKELSNATNKNNALKTENETL